MGTIITVATMKGGSGKSTLASCLAVHWHLDGRHPTIIDAVIIDTPGFRSETTLTCLAASDFVLVPVKPSPFDVDRMLDTLNMLINGARDWRPIFRCLLTQTTRESVIAKHIRSELAAAGFPLLESEMTNRVIYAEAALWGATPSLMDRGGPAARDIAAIAAEVDNVLAVKRAA